jgi:hypothetical protein
MNQLLLTLVLGTTSPFGSLRAGISAPAPPAAPFRITVTAGEPSHRVRNAVIGAAIGGAAGLITCTVISNIAKDPGTGFSTCTWKGYLLLGGSGAGLGALIGALIH